MIARSVVGWTRPLGRISRVPTCSEWTRRSGRVHHRRPFEQGVLGSVLLVITGSRRRHSLRRCLALFAIHLGEGGMANVYLAEDLKLHRKVAVKVLRPERSCTLVLLLR